MNIENLKWDLSTLYSFWEMLGDIPTTNDDSNDETGPDCIEEPFLHFPIGTHREEIWHWFESVNQRFVVGEVMEGKRLTPLTSRAGKHPVFDRNGVQLCVGDKLKAQICTGRYGQVAVFDFDVNVPHALYGQLIASAPAGAVICHFNWLGNPDIPVDICYYQHSDIEHGHETWAEVVARAAALPANT